jgi:hypothetical protein
MIKKIVNSAARKGRIRATASNFLKEENTRYEFMIIG